MCISETSNLSHHVDKFTSLKKDPLIKKIEISKESIALLLENFNQLKIQKEEDMWEVFIRWHQNLYVKIGEVYGHDKSILTNQYYDYPKDIQKLITRFILSFQKILEPNTIKFLRSL